MADIVLLLLLGLGVGLAVGLMGVGGGIVLVPALVYLLKMDQHVAQGTSLLLQLPPIGIGGLYFYWKQRHVDLRAGLVCALGFLCGGYFGSDLALNIPSRDLHAMFGIFLMFAAVMLWRQTRAPKPASTSPADTIEELPHEFAKKNGLRLVEIFLVASAVGVMGGMFGVGGGVMLVPLLVLLFHFDQHTAQGTSLVALVPPTGLLAFLNYWHAGDVRFHVGFLLMPGVFLGALAGSKLALRLSPRRMRRVFAVLLFLLGAWQVISSWGR
ncbi:MAG TPA: sulfite exporter TauE/SafE family protein [Candidatus Acidoferrales bacterium]|nr:sulfite exporter TauE/SafE family protein [Candidatus Acidoferrales bacterium]